MRQLPQVEFEEWAGSLHAAADRDLVYEATVDANVDLLRHGAEQGRFCEGCHAPGEMLAGRVTRHVAVPGRRPDRRRQLHRLPHRHPCRPGRGNGALTLAYDRAEAERDGPQGAALLADPRAHLAAYGAPDTTKLLAGSEICGACHTEAYDLSMSRAETRQDVQSTFVEWRDSWYARNGVTCQDCHMADDPAAQVMALRDGRLDKPARYSHRFIGANHVMTDTSLGDTLSVLRGGLLPGWIAISTRRR